MGRGWAKSQVLGKQEKSSLNGRKIQVSET